MNSWLQVLQAFRMGQFPQYYFGLTPRFLIGAIQVPIGRQFETPELARDLTENMFTEMKNFKEEGMIVVSNNCGIHDGPVMSLVEGHWSTNSIATSFEKVWLRYGDEIIIGSYHFSQEELVTLKKIFSID